MKNKFLTGIDFFYPLFRRIMPLQLFRYAVCGAINVCLDLTTFYIGYNLILKGNAFVFDCRIELLHRFVFTGRTCNPR